MNKLKRKYFMIGSYIVTLPILSSVVMTSCVPSAIEENSNNAALLSNLWNSASAEKDATALTTFNLSKEVYKQMSNQSILEKDKVFWNKINQSLKIKKQSEGKSIPVVFMDLDETVLNNYAYQNWLAVSNKNYSSETWTKWVNSEEGTEVKSSINFIKDVWTNGGVVMFNSNRDMADHKESTKRNLVKLGLPIELMPDWIWWMKGVDLSTTKPWNNILEKSNIEYSSRKEERMNLVSTKNFIIDSVNDVSFKVVMKVGDDFDDFNDNATKKITNSEKIEILDKETGKLFGNLDSNVKGKYYNPKTKMWEDLDYSESYVLMGGNASYGNFLSNIKDFFSSQGAKRFEIIKDALKDFTWSGPK
ncbi:MAG: acid phosphatase [Mycoplasmataceae bacterium]|nr:acid phosphatase [Mycoplasmataceae bacterium]